MKIFLRAAAVLAAVLSLTACSGKTVQSGGTVTSTEQQSQEQNSSGKTTLSLAFAGSPSAWNGYQLLWDKISKFNDTSDDYFVDVTIYDFDEDDSFGDSSAQRLSMDILAGNVPDIITASPFQLDKFRKNGYLTDLSPLMESGSGMKRGDFLDSVIESVDSGGEIKVIYPAFTVNTAIAKTELVGADSENWTIQQAISSYDSFGGDFLSRIYTQYDIRHYFFKGMMMNCVDFEKHTCDFSKRLAPVLDFLISLPPMEKRLGADESEIGQIYNDTALVKELWIPGINNYYANEILTDFRDEPFTFVGYPTDNGKGAFTEVGAAFGITATSPHQNEAWDALSQLIFNSGFQTEMSDDGYGVPVSKEVVEKLLNFTEYNNRSINAPVTLPDGSTMKLSEAQKQQLTDFLNTIDIDPFIDTAMEQLIKEESEYVFEGERSAEECVNILQNRFETYLSETQ